MNPPSIIHVEAAQSGQRLDRFLAEKIPDKSRSFLQGLIESGSILVNGKSVRKRYSIADKDEIQILWPNNDDRLIPEPEITLTILHEDDDILVINKPPYLAVHPGAGLTRGTLVNALLGYDPEHFEAMVDKDMRPGIVHRLDKDTSGVMVIAKNDESKNQLIQSFKNKEMNKSYLALVQGCPDRPQGTIQTLIGRNPRNRKKMAVVKKNGKEAETRFQVLARGESCSFLKIHLPTGRTHQIRVHMAYMNHPVIGDPIYRLESSQNLAPRQMLHAWTLEMDRPRTRERLLYEADVPEDMLSTGQQNQIDIKKVVDLHVSSGACQKTS